MYDRETAIPTSGDIVYPGRLYIDGDQRPYRQHRPHDRLYGHSGLSAMCWVATSSRPTRRNLEYPIGLIYQPNEHELELNRGNLLELQAVVREMGSDFKRFAMRDLTIYLSVPRFGRRCEPAAPRSRELSKTQFNQGRRQSNA
ncbi:MAG: hypothetical protein R2748_19005 [Bryobacterales bacterium]